MTKINAIVQVVSFTMLGCSLALATQGLAQTAVSAYFGQSKSESKSEAQFISYELPDGTYCVAIKESDHLALACDFDATQRKPITKPQEHRL